LKTILLTFIALGTSQLFAASYFCETTENTDSPKELFIHEGDVRRNSIIYLKNGNGEDTTRVNISSEQKSIKEMSFTDSPGADSKTFTLSTNQSANKITGKLNDEDVECFEASFISSQSLTNGAKAALSAYRGLAEVIAAVETEYSFDRWIRVSSFYCAEEFGEREFQCAFNSFEDNTHKSYFGEEASSLFHKAATNLGDKEFGERFATIYLDEVLCVESSSGIGGAGYSCFSVVKPK